VLAVNTSAVEAGDGALDTSAVHRLYRDRGAVGEGG